MEVWSVKVLLIYSRSKVRNSLAVEATANRALPFGVINGSTFLAAQVKFSSRNVDDPESEFSLIVESTPAFFDSQATSEDTFWHVPCNKWLHGAQKISKSGGSEREARQLSKRIHVER